MHASAFDFQFERTSSIGGFSVVLPKPFAELPPNSAISSLAVHRPVQSFVVGGKPAPGVIFLITKSVYGSITDARSVVTSLTTTQPPGFHRIYMKRSDAAGLPGIELKTSSSSVVTFCRVILHDETVFILTTEAPLSQDAEFEPRQSLLDLFELTHANKT